MPPILRAGALVLLALPACVRATPCNSGPAAISLYSLEGIVVDYDGEALTLEITAQGTEDARDLVVTGEATALLTRPSGLGAWGLMDEVMIGLEADEGVDRFCDLRADVTVAMFDEGSPVDGFPPQTFAIDDSRGGEWWQIALWEDWWVDVRLRTWLR